MRHATHAQIGQDHTPRMRVSGCPRSRLDALHRQSAKAVTPVMIVELNMFSPLSTRRLDPTELSQTYVQSAQRKAGRNLPNSTYILPGSFKSYRSRGENEAMWVRRYCNLTDAKVGLKAISEYADEDLKAMRGEWWQQHHSLNDIEAQLDAHASMAAAPQTLPLLYERIDVEAALTRARKASGIKKSNADLFSYQEEKADSEKELLRLQGKLDDLKDKSKSRDKRTGHHTSSGDQRSRTDIRKEKKLLRARISNKQSDITALQESIDETQRTLATQTAALVPEQKALAALIDKIADAGVSQQEQAAIMALLRQLDEVIDSHDRTNFLLEQGNIEPYYQADGQIVLPVGPHSKAQLRSLLNEVREVLAETEREIATQVKALKLDRKSDGSEWRSVRFNPQRVWINPELRSGNHAAGRLAALPAPESQGDRQIADANKLARRFSRERAQPSVPPDTGDSAQKKILVADVAVDGQKGVGPIVVDLPELANASVLSVVDKGKAGIDASPLLASASQSGAMSAGMAVTAKGLQGSFDVRDVHGAPAQTDAGNNSSEIERSEHHDDPDADSGVSENKSGPEQASSRSGKTPEREVSSPVIVNMTSRPSQALVPVTRQADVINVIDALDLPGVKNAVRSTMPTTPIVIATPTEDASHVETIVRQLPAVQEAADEDQTLPESTRSPSGYHYRAEDVDPSWHGWHKEYLVRPPEAQLADVTASVTEGSGSGPRLLGNTAYQEPQRNASSTTQQATEMSSSSYRLDIEALRERQAAFAAEAAAAEKPAASPKSSSFYGFTAEQLQTEGRKANANVNVKRSSTMPDAGTGRAQEPKQEPPLRRATEPANGTRPPDASSSQQRPRPPRTAYRQHVKEEAPTSGTGMPQASMPFDWRIPHLWIGNLNTLPLLMQDALIMAVRDQQLWTTIWHPDLTIPGPAPLKLYIVVRDKLPYGQVFTLNPGSPGPFRFTVQAGMPCHVLEVLPPLIQIPSSQMPYGGPTPNLRPATAAEQGRGFSFYSTDKNSPRYRPPQDTDHTDTFEQEIPKERNRSTANDFEEDGDIRPKSSGARRPASAEKPGKSRHRYAREEPAAGAEEQAKSSRRKHEKTPRTSKSERPSESARTREVPRDEVDLDVEIKIEVGSLIMRASDGKRLPPIHILGERLVEEARRMYVRNEKAKGIRVSSEQAGQLPESEFLALMENVIENPQGLDAKELKRLRPTMDNAKGIIDALRDGGLDLRMLKELQEDLGYPWKKNPRPDTFTTVFATYATRLARQELHEDRQRYASMTDAEYEAAVNTRRDALMENDTNLYREYLKKKYRNVFALDVNANAFQQMMGRVQIKLASYIVTLGAETIIKAAEKRYQAPQMQALLQHLALRKEGLSEEGIATLPDFKQIFDAEVDDRLDALARAQPAKFANDAMRLAQRTNLRKEMMGADGLALHERHLLAGEFGEVLRLVKAQFADNVWRAVIDETVKQMEDGK